tara:strand:- start:134 stop:1495 length:1362 start_codon:yes stop_codon:yes gene_type:complete
MYSSLEKLMPSLTNAEILSDANFNGISINSRELLPGNLFVAIKGHNFDAHDFLDDAFNKGAAAVIAERIPSDFKRPAITVPNTRFALGQIAKYWRGHFKIPIIGVTGSNGKTTVKEMISSIFLEAFGETNYLSTFQNFNNDIGVPLTLFSLKKNHKAAVLEIGMNQPGEIKNNSNIISPTIALVINAQREHLEFMENIKNIATENGEVIKSLNKFGKAIYPSDDTFTWLWKKYTGRRKSLTFGFCNEANIRCSWETKKNFSQINIEFEKKKFTINLNVPGIHNIRNALAACAACFALEIDEKYIKDGLESFKPINGRLQYKTAFNGALVIDDTYNANPDSVRAAIDVLSRYSSPKILILGDMAEMGNVSISTHAEIGEYAKNCNIDHVYTLGNYVKYASLNFGEKANHYENLNQLKKFLKNISPEANILIKGSRFMRMELVVKYLTETLKEGN